MRGGVLDHRQDRHKNGHERRMRGARGAPGFDPWRVITDPGDGARRDRPGQHYYWIARRPGRADSRSSAPCSGSAASVVNALRVPIAIQTRCPMRHLTWPCDLRVHVADEEHGSEASHHDRNRGTKFHDRRAPLPARHLNRRRALGSASPQLCRRAHDCLRVVTVLRTGRNFISRRWINASNCTPNGLSPIW